MADLPLATGTTLANWREPPWNQSAFWQVDALIETAPIAAAPDPSPLPPASDDLAGFSFVHAGAEQALTEVLAATHTDAWLVWQGGRIVHEFYRPPGAGSRAHILFSLSKSVFGTLAGVLVERQLLDPQAPVTDYLPEVAGSAYAGASVRQVLDMSVDTAFVEDYLDQHGDYRRYRIATGWHPHGNETPVAGLHAFLASMPAGAGRHGEVFRYRSPNSDLLGWVLERAGARSAAQMLAQWLWQPLGAEHRAGITLDAYGAARAAGGISSSLRDLARIGLLMLGRGEYQGRRIVASDWVEDIVHGGDPAVWARGDFAAEMPGHCYRSQWYKPLARAGTVFGLGIHGQLLYIDSAAELVVAKFSSQPQPLDSAMDALNLAACSALAQQFS